MDKAAKIDYIPFVTDTETAKWHDHPTGLHIAILRQQQRAGCAICHWHAVR